tara:strand:- start:4651 stop:4929 length:279 start_codon:yes stop_codon:yes gene_type:complete
MLKSTAQTIFNEIKGEITEFHLADNGWSNLTISVGHTNTRQVNCCCKDKFYEDQIKGLYEIGSKVMIRFYLSSRKKHDRWYTNVNILSIQKI